VCSGLVNLEHPSYIICGPVPRVIETHSHDMSGCEPVASMTPPLEKLTNLDRV